MSKKKLISIIISAIFTIVAAVLGCVYGIEVDFSGIDIAEDQPAVICVMKTHEEAFFVIPISFDHLCSIR